LDQPLKTKGVHTALCQYLRSRPDIGAFKAVCDSVLEPRNPFAPEAARAPRRWFVFFMLVATLLLASFAYFGNLR
jgi:hypothetical protein